MQITGWTNKTLKRTKLFAGGIIELPKDMENFNEPKVSFCATSRRHACARQGECSAHRPDCEYASKLMVGKTIFQALTVSDRKKIKGMLQALYKKCRVVTIDISEGSTE